MASKPRLARPHRVGDRVIAHGWRDNERWQVAGTIVWVRHSAIDGPIVVVLADAPELDGSPMFDVRAGDVELEAGSATRHRQ